MRVQPTPSIVGHHAQRARLTRWIVRRHSVR